MDNSTLNTQHSTLGDLPRLLVISHNPFSSVQNNGKTLEALLEGWPKERIAQIYLTRDDPDFNFCDQYYRIFDIEVLKNFLGGPEPGAVVRQEEYEPIGEELTARGGNWLYRLVREMFIRRIPIATCIRNLVWGRKKWITERFMSWLDGFAPEAVFFQSSNCTFAFDLVRWVCERYNIPLIMETTDDYVTGKPTIDPFFWIDIRRMQGRYRWAANYAGCVLAIGDKMAREYEARFGGRYKVAMNSVSINDNMIDTVDDAEDQHPQKILFAGNLGLNRWKVVEKVGHACALLAETGGVDAKLEIYSLVPPGGKLLKRLSIPGRMEYRGALDSEQLAARRREAAVLLHVESFDRKNKFITRLSVSTKIPEYMASGRCILAVGPGDVASVEYLRENSAGRVVHSRDALEIARELRLILGNTELRRECAAAAYALAAERHNRAAISAMVREEIVRQV